MREVIKFYDTNALLHNLDDIEGKIYLSSKTLQELEHIKTSRNKDEEVRFKARTITRFLADNEDRYECIVVSDKHCKILSKKKLSEDPDSLIVACAYELSKNNDVIFVTNDLCCRNVAKNIFGLTVQGIEQASEDYKGFQEVRLNDEEMSDYYEGKLNIENNLDLNINEYILIKNDLNDVVDALKMTPNGLYPIEGCKFFKSRMLGEFRPKDFYQKCVMDSLNSNTITSIKGKPGSGKSHIAMNYLFHQLEKGKIDKIIMFVNPLAVRGAAKLGFYKGDKNEKLLDSTIGNFLSGKLGERNVVDDMLAKGLVEILPIVDIRGYDTSGKNAGIYITEAQNMSIDLMKLALQRIGDDCVCIIDGDYEAQVDDTMFAGANNGMRRMSEVFRGQDLYGEVELQNIYRSKIAKIADEM